MSEDQSNNPVLSLFKDSDHNAWIIIPAIGPQTKGFVYLNVMAMDNIQFTKRTTLKIVNGERGPVEQVEMGCYFRGDHSPEPARYPFPTLEDTTPLNQWFQLGLASPAPSRVDLDLKTAQITICQEES